jgi:hypothetical protein
MQRSDIIIHHFARQLVDSVLHPYNRCTPDAAIDYSKEVLQDASLSQWHSKKVKQVLVHTLSKITLENFYFETGPSKIGRKTSYFDGTESVEVPEKITYILDQPSYQILSPKPSSPWHKLTFEGFIRAYCQARLQLKPNLRHSLLKTCSSLQEKGREEQFAEPINPLLSSSW